MNGGSSGDTGGSGDTGEGGGAYERLYLVGHSLGGALALTLLGADLLPGSEELEGRALPPVSVLTYGSPAAFHRRCKSKAVRKADVQAVLVPTLIVVGLYCTHTHTHGTHHARTLLHVHYLARCSCKHHARMLQVIVYSDLPY